MSGWFVVSLICHVFGHHFWRSEQIDQWGGRSRVPTTTCVRCTATTDQPHDGARTEEER